MEQLLARLLGVFPAYADDFLGLTTGPNRFIAGRLSRNELELRDALVFIGVSYLLAEVLTLPFEKRDLLLAVSNDMVGNCIAAIAAGLCLCLAWRCVGGFADLKQIFVIYFYYHGVRRLSLQDQHFTMFER
jgi:hypothetical protein